MSDSHYHVVIMAGGTGTRLAPHSTKELPKQFHSFTSDKTMIQETWSRVSPIARRDQIYVSTAKDYVRIVKEQLEGFHDDRIIVEPCPRDTLPAIAFVAYQIYQSDSDAIIVTTPSDHAIKNVHDFTKAVQVAIDVVEEYPDRIGMLGINPEGPSTALGYIQRGDEVQGFRIPAFKVDSFKEKPDKVTAEKYCSSGEYCWNGGYFVFKAVTLLALIEKFCPQVLKTVSKMQSISDEAKREALFRTLEKEPIDKAIIEKLSKDERFVVPADLGWSDVGTWNTLHEYLPKDDHGNVTRGNVVVENAEGNLIFATSCKVVAFGVSGLSILQVDGKIVVCKLDESPEIKKIIRHL